MQLASSCCCCCSSMSISKIVIHYFLFVIPSSSSSEVDVGSDTLSQGQLELRDGQVLSSSNKKFRLKFYSPGRSRKRYLGIFAGPYYQDSPSGYYFPVWVANRNNPLPDTSGALMIDDSMLKISYSGGNPIILSSKFGSSVNISATLLGDGNFVLRDVSTHTRFWQSFDFPTDTLLPGMKLGHNFKTGHNWSLTSMISEDVPASGSLTLGGDPNRSTQLILSWHGNPYWTSVPLQNGRFHSLRDLDSDYLLEFSHTSNENESYLTYSVNNNENFVTLTLDTGGWIFIFGSTGFGTYNPCFIEVTSARCVGGMLPECRKGDYNFTGHDVWVHGDSYVFNENENHNMGIFDCRIKCEQNCSCIAYASSADNGTGCQIWTNDATFESSRFSDTRVYILQTRDTSLPSFQRARKRRWILAVTSAGGALLTLSFMLFCILRCLKTKDTTRTLEKCSTVNDIEYDMRQVQLFSFGSIEIATNNFSTANKLGEGGFGPVYKGELPGGQEVAVKRLSRSSGQGLLEFKNEILLIAKLQHNNLVKILGCCIQGQEMILVYEYMPNKSLDFFIFDPTRRELLKWTDRMKIIEGVAQGLVYLHKHSRLRVIHRDLKASNILLDQNLNPKISDFGMARIFGKQESEANTNRIVGTYFGVLVLEIVCGKKNHGCYDPERPLNLIGLAWELWIEGRALELMDTTLDRTNHENEVTRAINVGLLCVQDCASDRPSMVDVFSMLTHEYLQLPAPKKPAFFIDTSTSEAKSEVTPEKACTNELSISLIEAR